MNGDAIFGPFLALMLLTLAVWVVMYVRRLSYFHANKVDVSELKTPRHGAAVIPEAVSYPALNLMNLFELPVVFYALCIYLHVAGLVDHIYVSAAWVFVALRVVHSIVHSTVNIVVVRFLVYVAGAVALWFMLVRAALEYFA